MTAADQRRPVRVVRLIGRLNIGGPSIQAITLTKRLEARGYATTLVRGREGPREGSMDDLAAQLGVRPKLVRSLRRDPGLRDLVCLVAVMAILRRERPDVVHTHAAKAGTIGRLATVLAFPRRRTRPVLVHTFHGHSLTGYFSPRTEGVYRTIERVLARATDRLIAVSDEVRDDLVGLAVAEARRFAVIALGFDLNRFAASEERRLATGQGVRDELGIPRDCLLVTLVARLVPIKRVDRFLQAARLLADRDDVRFLIVGDGPLRDELHSSPDAQVLADRLTWAGFRRDMPAVCFASDVVVLTSDNEGTPVSLIEASAAGRPTVSTRVGGAARVIRDGETGLLVDREPPAALADAIRRLISDASLRERMGRAASAHATGSFSLERLADDLDRLYQELLRLRGDGVSARA